MRAWSRPRGSATPTGRRQQSRRESPAADIWPDKPAKARQKDTDGRWTVKYSKAKVLADGTRPIDIAIPVYGYKSHVSIDRMHGLIRRQVITDAAQHDGARLREGLIARTNTARSVWADSAYRSAENEAWLAAHGMVSRIHRKKTRGRPMPKRTRRANAAKSAVRSKVEHVFAQQKARMGMTIRTIGLARAGAAITLANMAFNMTRWRWLDSRPAPA